MRKPIAKFEALSGFNPNDILKEYDLSTKEIDKIIDTLKKYEIEPTLLSELKLTQTRQYRDLRKWKVNSFIGRYEKIKPLLDEIFLIEDYMLELSDQNYKVYINPSTKTIQISFYVNASTAIQKINIATTHLLQTSHRLKLDFETISYRKADRYTSSHNSVVILVDYDIIP